MQHALSLAAVAGLLVAAAPAGAQVFSDNFDDNAVGDAYELIVDNEFALDIDESNGAARVTSTGLGQPQNDAIYLTSGADGFKLSTASDFSASIAYRFDGVTGGRPGFLDAVSLVFGIGEDLDGQNSAAVGFGYVDAFVDDLGVGGGVFSYRSGDVDQETTGFLATSSGTFTVAYDASVDELTFTAGTSTPIVRSGIVQGQWNADCVYLSFGARGNGFAADPATTYLDNFVVTQGTLVPEPTSLAVALGTLGLLAARRRR